VVHRRGIAVEERDVAAGPPDVVLLRALTAASDPEMTSPAEPVERAGHDRPRAAVPVLGERDGTAVRADHHTSFADVATSEAA